jgi:hypothetical protein
MSSLAAFANLDVDKLITDIASRPAIWDKNFNGRQNKGFLEDTWDELVSRTFPPSNRRPLILASSSPLSSSPSPPYFFFLFSVGRDP